MMILAGAVSDWLVMEARLMVQTASSLELRLEKDGRKDWRPSSPLGSSLIPPF